MHEIQAKLEAMKEVGEKLEGEMEILDQRDAERSKRLVQHMEDVSSSVMNMLTMQERSAALVMEKSQLQR